MIGSNVIIGIGGAAAVRATELAGNVMVWSCPALARGGWLTEGSGTFLQEAKIAMQSIVEKSRRIIGERDCFIIVLFELYRPKKV